MRFFETAKLAAGIDPDKKLLGGREKAAVLHEWSAFFCVAQAIWRGRAFPFVNPSVFQSL